MHAYAQTNLQLYNQMRRAGYAERDLDLVRRAYELGTVLFAGAYRGSGKPLLAHLVGTASILVSVRARPETVAAAVLHAAYMLGEFGDGRRGATPAKRARVREAVGRDVEALIDRYDALAWNATAIPGIAARAATLEGADREALLIRLANELEDHLDLGVLYCGNADERRAAIRTSLSRCIDIARVMGYPELSAEYERVFAEIAADDIPAVLRHPHDYSYQAAPLSHRPRLHVRLRQALDRHPGLGRALRPLRRLAALARGRGVRLAFQT
ncbi:MAG TPA: HD domain-containing protein [Vicinamibacterales bacterium]|nr:HD domain-containing protein [Vicinamibacterales bacterium]